MRDLLESKRKGFRQCLHPAKKLNRQGISVQKEDLKPYVGKHPVIKPQQT